MKKLVALVVAASIMFSAIPAMAKLDDETVEQIIDIVQDEELEEEARILAKLLYRECRGVKDTAQQAAVAWVVLNRVNNENYPDTVYGVVSQRHQFAWSPNTPVTDELYELALDVLIRWRLEQQGHENVGRVIPEDYIYFAGNGTINRFRTEYRGGSYWKWRLESPY